MKKILNTTISIILCFIILSCKKDISNPVSPNPIPDQKKEKKFPYGIWENVSYSYAYKYFNYDSSTAKVTVGGDEGHNFRTQSILSAKTDSVCVYINEGSGIYEKWLWYDYDLSRDTLILSIDSLFTVPMKFVQKPLLTKWVDVISNAIYWRYPTIKDWVLSLAYADSNWYVLTGSGENNGVLHIIKYGGVEIKTISFPYARSMDVADGYLWISDRNSIEKRKLNDTSLVEKYYLRDYIKLNNQDGWIQGISVNNNSIYVSAAWEHFITLSTNGVLKDTGYSYIGLQDLAVSNNQIWGVTTSDKFYEIDPINKSALHSYLIGYPYLGRYQGIATMNNQIACADNWYNELRIYLVDKP